ncbi:DUF6138 family protein [Chitinophaga solisilvae]|uniref:DUF6138 family protein n=1 Tax=Chitinophaga solisilvae TaxID=1233460 RepID=UPI0013708DC8|nr:DUF6138 family protein [Chitinophaga solisilvae]
MDSRQQTVIADIKQAIAQLLERLDQRKHAADIVKRTTLQAGIHDYVRFSYKQGEILLYTDTDNKEVSLRYEGAAIPDYPQTTEDITALQPLLDEALQQILATYDDAPIIDYHFTIAGGFLTPAGKINMVPLTYISQQKKTRLLENITIYLQQKITGGQYPTKDLQTFFLSRHLLDNRLFPSPDIPEIIAVFEKILQLNKQHKEQQRQHRYYIITALRHWAEEDFLPQFYDVEQNAYQPAIYTRRPGGPAADPQQLELLLYAAVMIIKYEPNYARATGTGFVERAGELGSARAGQLLKTGSGAADAVYADEQVACSANDVFATISIQIKKEGATAYGNALQFILRMLQQEFPYSYEIRLKSSVKQFLPLKGLGKTATHRFFANALQYPELFPVLETYAATVIQREYEWYNDAEAELCAMPGTYAVFGLGLAGDRYFPLVSDYMQRVDTEHQSVQNVFTRQLAVQYGVHAGTVPVLVKCLLACQDHKPMKELGGMESAELLPLLVQCLQPLQGYEAEHVAYFIWGGKEKLAARAKKHAALQEVLALTART